MENINENNENTDNNKDVGGKIIKPIQQQQQQPETENNLQLQQQQPPQQHDVQQQLQLQEQGGIAKQIETPGEKTLEQQQPLLPEEFEGDEDDDEDDDDDDDDEEKEISQKLIIDIPDEEEEDEDEDDDVIALDDLPTEAVLAPKQNAEENAKSNIKKPAVVEAIITLSDGEEDIPANEIVSKPGKVQKRRSVGSNAAAGNDEERFRLKRRKINVEGAPKMPLTGYVRYMNDRRESLRKEHPTKTAMEHTKMIGEEWHSLPADVKASYLKAADADKQRLF